LIINCYDDSMKNYELTYLVSQRLSEEGIKNLSSQISTFIQEAGGIILKISEAIKKKLAYEIKDESEAFLTVINFSSSPENLKNINSWLKEKREILRHIIVIKRDIKETPMRRISPKMDKQPIIDQSKDKKVELKEIDQKIDEILK